MTMQKKLNDYLLKKSKEMIKLFGIVFFLFLIIPAYLHERNTDKAKPVAIPCEVVTPMPRFVERDVTARDSTKLLQRFQRLERKARQVANKVDTLELIRDIGNFAIFN